VPEVVDRLTTALSVEAYDRSNTTQLATGTVETIDNVIDPTTGMVKLRALFANPKSTLFPSQFVNARLLVNTLHNVTRVPVAAVQQGANGAFVYVIKPDSTVSVTTVKLGVTDGLLEQVVSGLSPGDRVVTDGTDRLREGAKVTVPAVTGASAAANGTTPGATPGTTADTTPETTPGTSQTTPAGTGQQPSGPGTTPASGTPEQPAAHRHHQQSGSGQQGQQAQ
jgi:membrane fusion protein, multidrug efflux system